MIPHICLIFYILKHLPSCFGHLSCTRVGDNYCVYAYYGGIVLINERCYGVTCVSIYQYKSLYSIVVGVDNVTSCWCVCVECD